MSHEELMAYQQFKKFVDLATFAEREIPSFIIQRYADKDLTELLKERLQNFLGEQYNPLVHKINLREIFNNCKSQFVWYPFWKDKGQEEEERRFAIFQCNTLRILNYELIKQYDTRNDMCRRSADRTKKELDEVADRMTNIYKRGAYAPIQTIRVH